MMKELPSILAVALLLASCGLSCCAVLFLWGLPWSMLCGAAWCLIVSVSLMRGLTNG